MIERDKDISTQQKALQINLDNAKYGTIVEIGAGQEVARQFFSAGAAAGTVAKTMSAYDMKISDEIYGKAGAYVGRERLEQMLNKEFELILDRLTENRCLNTTFFSYAATVTARSFKQKNECHGWVGVQVQLYPSAPPSEIILHVRMLDEENSRQSEALGILGVNLIYGAYFYKDNPKWIIDNLLDNLDSERLEIDLINFRGPYFEGTNNRLMNLHLVRSWCCRAVMFDDKGSSIVPSSALRKKDVLVMRGSFRPPTKIHTDMSDAAQKLFKEIGDASGRGTLTVAEVTMAELNSEGEDDSHFLARVDLLVKLGYNVLISDYLRYFRLRSWIRNYTDNYIGIILNIRDFDGLFTEKYYDGLEGGTLEAMGKLFSDDTYVYVYPAEVDGTLISLNNVDVGPQLDYLLKYLIANKSLVAIEDINKDNLHISTRQVIKQLSAGSDDWKKSVPDAVAAEIIEKKLFGYRG